MKRNRAELAKHNAWIKKHHGKLRRAKRCIGGRRHGRAFRGGRCRRCWEQKLANEREQYAKTKRRRKQRKREG